MNGENVDLFIKIDKKLDRLFSLMEEIKKDPAPEGTVAEPSTSIFNGDSETVLKVGNSKVVINKTSIHGTKE